MGTYNIIIQEQFIHVPFDDLFQQNDLAGLALGRDPHYTA